MKIAIVGAGIIGITTAYELASDGHEVTVFERASAAAEEASFANAGVIAPNYVTPWAAPGMPSKVLKLLCARHAPVKLGWSISPAEIAWIWKWWRACNLDTYLENRSKLRRLALYSCKRLHQLTDDLKLEYDYNLGYMVLLRGEKDMQLMQPNLHFLREQGVPFSELTGEDARRIEPALNSDISLAGAIHLPNEEIGNCRQFALLLKRQAEALGVKFEFNARVAPLDRAQPSTLQLSKSGIANRFDAVVICAALASADLVRPLGFKIPLAGVRGYSISAQIREPLYAPRSGLMDEHYKVTISRLGNRVRVAGIGEIGGSPELSRDSAIRTLYKVLLDWFPGSMQISNIGAGVQEWKGTRPMLPDGQPLIGASGVPGVWFNFGHGSSGWALSCGSARVIADLINGKAPALDTTGFGPQRWGN